MADLELTSLSDYTAVDVKDPLSRNTPNGLTHGLLSTRLPMGIP